MNFSRLLTLNCCNLFIYYYQGNLLSEILLFHLLSCTSPEISKWNIYSRQTGSTIVIEKFVFWTKHSSDIYPDLKKNFLSSCLASSGSRIFIWKIVFFCWLFWSSYWMMWSEQQFLVTCKSLFCQRRLSTSKSLSLRWHSKIW